MQLLSLLLVFTLHTSSLLSAAQGSNASAPSALITLDAANFQAHVSSSEYLLVEV
jgi:hypothetical protein